MLNKFSPFDFLVYTKIHPMEWIHYCEIIIDPNGAIILARPSHQEAVIEYAATINEVDREAILADIGLEFSPFHYLIGKYGLVAVWYGFGIYSNYKGLNQFQKHTLDILKKNNLISQEFELSPTNEYNLSIERYGEPKKEETTNA
jgi:hypothetical protein